MDANSQDYAGLQNVGGSPELTNQANPVTSELVFGFQAGGLGFLLPTNLHCEVIAQLPVSPIPNVEPWFSGLVNIRGNIVPVLDLHKFLGEPVSPAKKRYLFAMDKGEKGMALWIDGYPQLLTGIREPLNPLPALPVRMQGLVANAYLYNGQIWLDVPFGQLFKTLGRQQVAKETSA